MANLINIGGGAGGGSGSSVIPNPQGTATDTLVKLGIEGTIYDFAGSSGHNYSTTEHAVGTWIDGSTIYEKTINVNQTLRAGQHTLSHNIVNIDKCISIVACCTYNGSNEWLYLPYLSPTNVSGYSVSIGNVNQSTYMVTVGASFQSVENLFVTIRYTKSTT